MAKEESQRFGVVLWPNIFMHAGYGLSGVIYNGVVFKIKTSTISDLLSKVEISEINNDFNFCGINHNSKANLNLLLKAMRLFTNEKYSIKKSLEKQVKDGISITSINKIILDI